VAAYDRGGGLSWVRGDGGPGDDRAMAIGAAPYSYGGPSGGPGVAEFEIEVSGTFEDGASFTCAQPLEQRSAGGADVYRASYSGSPPAAVWVTTGGSPADDEVTGARVRTVTDGRGVYHLAGVDVAGTFAGSAFASTDWGSALEGCGQSDGVFLVQTAYDVGGPPEGTTTTTGGCDVNVETLAVAEDGELLLAGDFGPAVRLDLGPVDLAPLHGGGRDGMVLVRGPVHEWTFTVAGPEDAAVTDVCFTDGGRAAVGWFRGTATFGPGLPSAVVATAEDVDGFIVDLSEDGEVLGFTQLGGLGDQRALRCATLWPGATVYGTFAGTLTATGTTATLTARGPADLFAVGHAGDPAAYPPGLSVVLAGDVRAVAPDCRNPGPMIYGCCALAAEFHGDVTVWPGSPDEQTVRSAGGSDLVTLFELIP
jgi:hypothetical protein